MSELSTHDADEDPGQLVRVIARLAQMIIELRDEYVAHHRSDDLDQIERRIDQLSDLRRRLAHARESRDDVAP
ncbi:MAG TPA: hypothetical protein PK593_11175 [Thermomicrobiales bacterium]|jgi:hypothetical protein|nr:hypothetical protein [Chloroflexota bacterium]HQX64007.1 hypothetical protein [Thermomicrobiales bacterium]HBY46106.1 hypothetical protein [Chloroflexota bacterium]HCG29552.1 hypothetical protein [Chloroflexota bacterium]HQZ89583.1 hypothetical protein [Thermomicrobiales bacterium]